MITDSCPTIRVARGFVSVSDALFNTMLSDDFPTYQEFSEDLELALSTARNADNVGIVQVKYHPSFHGTPFNNFVCARYGLSRTVITSLALKGKHPKKCLITLCRDDLVTDAIGLVEAMFMAKTTSCTKDSYCLISECREDVDILIRVC